MTKEECRREKDKQRREVYRGEEDEEVMDGEKNEGKGRLKVQDRLFGIRSSEHRNRQTFLEKL